MAFIVAAFYHFFDFPHYADAREELRTLLVRENIKGSILLASEGINGTVSGRRESIDRLLEYLECHVTQGPFEHKESLCEVQPFKRAKVRLKKETISLGEPTPLALRGEYIDPKDWNALISDPDTILIDTRNSYEVHVGTFENARDPGIRNFKELPAYTREHLGAAKHKKIATFCTGGIRCEKYTAWLKAEGYEHVYHLRGGILKYLEEIPEAESKWKGECYVFDERVAVGHGLHPSTNIIICANCGYTVEKSDKINHSCRN